jgi:hypothetical protein
MLIEHRPYHLN